jgi:hypothetical protein
VAANIAYFIAELNACLQCYRIAINPKEKGKISREILFFVTDIYGYGYM